MTRLNVPFTAFRLWWRGASNGPRSRAVAAGTATLAFLAWTAVPSGGGLLTNFAAGFPTNATTQPANATAPPLGQGSSLASSTSDLAVPPLASPDTAGLGAEASAASPSDNSAMGEGVAGDAGGASSTPGSAGEPAPTAPSSTCPVSFPATNSPLDGLAAQLAALCTQLLAGGPGAVPTGSLPGGGSAGQARMGGSQVPKRWMYLDSPVGASGAPNASWSPGLSAEMAGKSPVVLVGLVQGSPVSPALTGAVGDLVHDGVLVQPLLVPEPGASGGPPAFASWVVQVLATLGPVQLVEIGTGGAPQGVSPATVATYTAAGLVAAHEAAGRPAAGILWLDGGTTSIDQTVWSSLESAGVWSKSSFVAASLDAAGACTSPASFAATLRRYPPAAILPVVSEARQGPAPARWVTANYSCLKGSVAQNPAHSLVMWRLWEGSVAR